MRSIARIFRAEQSPLRLTIIYSLPFIVIAAGLLLTIVLWEAGRNKDDLITELKEMAKAYFGQIMLTRLWVAGHGGIYAEITEKTKPNPYLEDSERDITSTGKRKKYTKMNPAYVTRQLSELSEDRGKYKFHMVSLKPINPDNKPDEWEAGILESFENGKKEGYEFKKINGVEYFRYVAPLITEKPCLRCHAKQGYKVGDIRGGLSISIPTDVHRATHAARLKRNAMAFGVISLISLSSIIGMTWMLSKKIAEAIKSKLEHERLKAAIHLAGATAHELRQPMTIITGVSELLKDKIEKGEPVHADIEIIVGQCLRMNDIIKKMLSITQYRTKVYANDTEIFDLDVKEGTDKGESP